MGLDEGLRHLRQKLSGRNWSVCEIICHIYLYIDIGGRLTFGGRYHLGDQVIGFIRVYF